MEYISRSLPMYVCILWVFIFPTVIGFTTQNILAFWIFIILMAISYYLYARNFYVIYKDDKNLYAKNTTNLFAKKYIIPLSSIQNYQVYTVQHRKVLCVQTKNKEIFFIPCYKLKTAH